MINAVLYVYSYKLNFLKRADTLVRDQTKYRTPINEQRNDKQTF